jgi:hypothetical protein
VDDEGPLDGVFKQIGRFEDGAGMESKPWLGGAPGLVLGLVVTLAAAAMTPLACGAVYAVDSRIFGKLAMVAWMAIVAATMAYWRRQRLAAHFEAANRRLGSGDPADRDRGLVDLIVNARRGQAEHGRIAAAVTGYLRRAPEPHAGEPSRRQIAFSMLADFTLSPLAKERIDLTGAKLAGIRGVGAELRGACLRGADLSGAKLARANLELADLRDARLDGADLAGARLEGALLA